MDEMRKSEKIKFTLIDEFVNKVNNYIAWLYFIVYIL